MQKESTDKNEPAAITPWGNKSSFEALYREHYISVFYVAKRFVTDIQAAEDITTESFLKLWERIADFNSEKAVKSFLFVTVKNGCLNYLRSVERQHANHMQLVRLLESDLQEDIERQRLTAEIFQHIHDEIRNLSPQLRSVFTMAYIEGLSNEEIALKLGINNQSVRNDKSRALKQLRFTLSEKNILTVFCILYF